MSQRLVLKSIAVVIFTLFLITPVQGGGWAVVTLDSLPPPPRAGEALHLGFTVRQHGDKLISNVTPALAAENMETGEALQIDARKEGPVGHFVVEVTFPSPGTWTWGITPHPFPSINQFVPLTVLSPMTTPAERSAPPIDWAKTPLTWLTGALAWVANVTQSSGAPRAGLQAEPVAPASELNDGQALFVAKGCLACHYHPVISWQEFPQAIRPGVQNPWSGPDFTHYRATPEFLRRWLHDPQAIRPDTVMPNLGLSEDEIGVLIDFISQPEKSETTSRKDSQASPKSITSQMHEPAERVSSIQSVAPSAELFFVRPHGAKGTLLVYDMATRQRQFTLPAGMLATNGSRYYVATVRGNTTNLDVFEPHAGTLEQTLAFNGQWTLSGVSPTGRWVALTHLIDEQEKAAWIKENRWETTIQIVDIDTGHAANLLELQGNFEVETISASGDALFLIQHLPAVAPAQYLVRLYDLSAETLNPNPLRAKTATDEVMTGLAWGGFASPDGEWLLTLYVNTERNLAFIHALNLVNKTPFCIFLPSDDGDFERLKSYTLALASDGQTVYAANANLGIVAKVNLKRFAVIDQIMFEPAESSGKVEFDLDYEPQAPASHSILSPDEERLYFSNGHQVWVYMISKKRVDEFYRAEAAINGLGISHDGAHLYIATEARAVQVINTTGQTSLSVD